ncbi:MAG: methionine adenosyltransferase [Alphaproteobacteria bacterium]|nr:methionine adenosyltransferase [Alphaproteobacteria bacterium]OJV11931.1 MAG: methionine adenosyltransferase [Alphaproteobacteria bacterium 33-17]
MEYKRVKDYIFTSESVSEGHPDKLCDMVSDSILDTYLKRDPMAKVAVECLAMYNRIVVAGEIRGPEISKEEIEKIVRNAVKSIGYDKDPFNADTITVDINLNRQSPDIAMGVDGDENKEEGAGDQGIMFGYACNETKNLMPAPIYYAHKILRTIFGAIHLGALKGVGPDAKSQISIQYKDGKPVGVDNILVSIQHDENLSQKDVKDLIKPYVVQALPEGWMCSDSKFLVNPTGRFTIGGPVGDTGLTGRKIIVDTYGGAAPHGGGAFSGKDPSKVDRSGAYAARYIAKNIVASGLAEKCTIQIAYAIGVAKPLSIYVSTHGTGIIPESEIIDIIHKVVDLTPKGMRTKLQLNKPIYARTAAYGHFGREAEVDGGFSWERLDLVEEIKKYMPK